MRYSGPVPLFQGLGLAVEERLIAIGSIAVLPAGTVLDVEKNRGSLQPFTGKVRLQTPLEIGPLTADLTVYSRPSGEVALQRELVTVVHRAGSSKIQSGSGAWAGENVAGQDLDLLPGDTVAAPVETSLYALYGAPGTTAGTMPCAGVAEVRQSDGSCVAPPCPGNQVRLGSGLCGCPPGYTKTAAGICLMDPCPSSAQIRLADGTCGCPQQPGWFTMPDGKCVAGGCPPGYTPSGSMCMVSTEPPVVQPTAEEPWYKKTSTWLLIGGGVVATGLLVWLAMRKKSPSTGEFGTAHGEWGVRWQEWDRNNRLVTKEKVFGRGPSAVRRLDRFVEDLKRKEKFHGILSWLPAVGPGIERVLGGTGGFGDAKYVEAVAKYSDPSAAHEFALKLKSKGWRSVQIRKRGQYWVVSGVEPRTSASTGGFGDMTQLLNAISGEGFHDEETGSVTESGRWYGLFRGPLDPAQMASNWPEEWASLDDDEKKEAAAAAGFILTEDSQGFKDSEVFTSEEKLNEKWDEIAAEQAAFYQEEEEE